MNPNDIPDELITLAQKAANTAPQKRDGKPTRTRYAIAAVWPEIEKRVREQVAAGLREDADAHRRTVERKPSEYDEARLARARTLDDAAARITGKRRDDG